jgi:hypothetical protein
MRRRALTRLIGWFLVLTASVCAVGSVVGAVTGSAIGLATESGMLRGAGIGAISGAVFSIEVAESSRDLWHSSDSAVWCLVYMVRPNTHCFSRLASRDHLQAFRIIFFGDARAEFSRINHSLQFLASEIHVVFSSSVSGIIFS